MAKLGVEDILNESVKKIKCDKIQNDVLTGKKYLYSISNSQIVYFTFFTGVI